MPPPKVELVARFEIPTESMLRRGPEHKIQHAFSADGVRRHTVSRCMNPLRPNARHELRFFRECPRLLEQKVDLPFGRVTGEKRSNSRLKFQLVLYRRNFDGKGWAKARCAAIDIPVRGS